MPDTQLVEAYKNFLENMSNENSSASISETDGNKAYEEINREMKISRSEFARLEKESQRITSEILINV